MSDDAELFALARRVTEEVLGPPPFAIGDCVHRPDGRLVKITAGQWWGMHGLSNFWYWREVFPNGGLGETESGYGWNPGEASPHEGPVATTLPDRAA